MGRKRPYISLAMKRSWVRYKGRPSEQTTEDTRWEMVRLRFLGLSLREIGRILKVDPTTVAFWVNRAKITSGHQNFGIAAVLGAFFAMQNLRTPQTFSIGEMSGDIGGHARVLTWLLCRKAVVAAPVWARALSYRLRRKCGREWEEQRVRQASEWSEWSMRGPVELKDKKRRQSCWKMKPGFLSGSMCFFKTSQ